MKTITKIFAAMAFALPFVNAEAEDYGFGDMGGVFNVSESGAATYTLPFDLPEGINGMVPSLGLVYNSQSGNGVAGMGISIYGTSVITRTAKDIYHDGTAKGIGYNDNDVYSLDGVRLLQLGQADFRAENSPQDVITKLGSGSSQTFKINLQNGNTAYYNYTAKAGNVPYAWYLSRLEDKYGNVIGYSYTTINGCVYLTQVQYGTNLGASTGLSNIVTFEYGSRADAIPYIVNGQSCTMNRRLTSVTIKTNSVERNKYTLTYSNTDAFSRLTKIEESYGTTKLPPVTLGWSKIPSTLSVSTIGNIPFGTYDLYGDINGDGMDDIIYFKLINSKVTINPYYASLTSGALSFSNNESINVDCGSISKGQFMLADINGNGKKDVVVATKTSSAQTFTKVSDYLFTINIGDQNSLLDANDFYRDGKSEIICLNKTTTNSNHGYLCRLFCLSTNNATQKTEGYLNLTSAPQAIKTADFNGNGMQDLIVLHSTGYTIYWNNGTTSTSFPFSESNKTTKTLFKLSDFIDFGDFDGDGLLDILLAYQSIEYDKPVKTVNNLTVDICVAINNGNGCFTPKNMCTCIHPYKEKYPSHTETVDISCCIADFNNDGKADAILAIPSYNTDNREYTYIHKWLKSSGEQLSVIKSTELNYSRTPKAGDFNGDGFTELLNHGKNVYNGSYSDTQLDNYVYKCNTTSSTNKLTSISVGQSGIYTTISYSTLCDANVYTKGSSSPYPLATLCVPLSVVKQVYQNLAYNSYYTNYKYSGLRAHLQGRGMLGFTTVEANNSTTGEKRTTTVNSLNATYYEPSKMTNTITKGGKSATTETTFSTLTSTGYKTSHFTYPETVKETGFYGELTTTTNTYDSRYHLTKQYTKYNVTNMYRQVEYSSYVGNKPGTVVTTQKHKDDANTFTTKTTYTYDGKGKVTTMVENASTVPVTHEYTYSSFGNMETHTVSASGITAVTTTLKYDATNRFVASEKSSANSLITNYTYNNLGRLTKKQEGISGSLLTTSYTYDAIGNITKITHPDGTATTYTRSWGTMPYRRNSVTTKTTGQAATTTWYDNLGREVETTSTGEKGVTFTNSTSYDFINGNVSTQSRSIGSISLTDYYTYDNMGQLTKSVTGTGQTTTFSYSKRSVAASQGNGKYLSKSYDPWGNLTTVSHNQCSSASYKIASNGQPTSINYNDASGQSYTVATMAYDKRGLQSSLTDVDAGKTSYVYDALGRVTKQTDARGNITTKTYNASGLLIKQVCGGVTTTYEYDSNLRLKKETAGSQSVSYTYDTYNRLTKKTYSIDGTVLTFSYTYNSNGQMATQTFPDGMTENYTYDANGYLTAIKIGGQRVWERDSYTGTQRRWALGTQPLYVTRKYSDKGLLTEQEIIRQAGSLHKMTYSFDGATGNLTQRNGMNGTETFKYDQFDRLNTGTSYAPNGNIASKTGIGKYTYDTGKKNAVVQVENTGNLIQGAASLTYNAFNKVATVVQGTNTLTITYGPDRQRTKTVLVNGSNTTTTLYADNYEQRTVNGTTTTYHYVASPDGLAAVYVKKNGTTTPYYVETDHLGSIINLFDASGTKQFSATYDAWGKQTITKNAMGLTRGYTGHEHWNVFGLIDMNGRFYDPLLGRFLSPDPFIQSPDNPQNFNRYSYCLNNPLKYVDPSGYQFDDVGRHGNGDEYESSSSGGGIGNSKNDGYWIVYWRSSFTGNWCSADSYGTFTTYAYTPFAFHSGSSGSPNLTNSHPQIGNDYIKAGGYGYSGRSGGRGGSGGGGRTIRQPIRKNVVVQNGGGSIASTATTTATNIASANAKTFDVVKAVTYLTANAYPEYIREKCGYCARAVRTALEAGGIDTSERPKYAKDYGPYLKEWGFNTVDNSSYMPQMGDIRVFQPYEGGNIAGHIDMYNGTQWVSDYIEKNPYCNNFYRDANDFVIFRW